MARQPATNASAAKHSQSKRPSKRTQPVVKSAGSTRGVSSAKSIKDRILFILQDAPALIGLRTIKKRLVSDFGMVESKLFNTNVNKALRDLSSSGPRDDFGRHNGSYHGGPNSPAFIAHQAKPASYVPPEGSSAGINEDWMMCCHCHTHCDSTFLDEDSTSRGCAFRCSNCDTVYWTWISDGATHPVEYARRHRTCSPVDD
ncbi:hypothetical protein H310_13834 [Aphanomyces invadans]|uniref:Uncharacterized protein n=1 Tax=Aphanomyces invadans TaxID=157072 RepID=A0A024TCK4_9STRA|nr:hypothetical protein H310_13834 [Aphanomyces invadans]ETV91778.1 hypothetical protein H310_13834 [Aphanomyces invadans]|eukprot:XP_008879704.1 hypothetical protein H310_13834 [Aphanomyces invadans]